MTDKKSTAKKKAKGKAKPDATPAVPREETQAAAADTTAPTTNTEPETKATETSTPTEQKEEPQQEQQAIGPISGCKVFGQPDVHHKKCRVCKDLKQCLALDALRKESKPKKKKSQEVRGRDFIGFLKGSQKSAFALHIAKSPSHMKDIKSAPWNKRGLTWYDTFNSLRRNVDSNGEPLPLAEKDKTGTMFILEKNLSKTQRDQLKKEVEEFPY